MRLISAKNLVFTLGSAVLMFGCVGAQRQALVDRQLEELNKEIRDLRGSYTSVETQVEEVQGQLVLLEDRVRLATRTQPARMNHRSSLANNNGYNPNIAPGPSSPATRRNALPVVQLGPPTAKATSPAASNPDVLVFQSLNSSGKIESNRGVQPTAPPAAIIPRQPPVKKQINRGSKLDYDAAFSQFRDGHMGKAERSFSRFVDQHPSTDLTDNALYWWGECRYHQKDYLGALRLFQRVIEEQPGGNKVPDAMVKMGLSLVNLKQKDEGLQILAQVMVIYPDTTSARVAEKRRQEILRSK